MRSTLLQHNGSETSFPPGISHREMLTNEASQMSAPATCAATASATSSQGLAAGLTPCASPDGLMPSRSGQVHARVSRFRSRDNNKAIPTSDTSGPLFTVLSPSAALQLSLESRLRAALAGNGSLPYGQTWKSIDMPSGPPCCQLSVSAPRISVTEPFGSLPTPTGTSNHGKNHVAGRIDEWGGSANYFRGTEAGRLHLPGFELWTMGFPDAWRQLMPPATQSSPKSRRLSYEQRMTPSANLNQPEMTK